MSPVIDTAADDAARRALRREPSDDPAADRAVSRMLKLREMESGRRRTRALIAGPPGTRAKAIGISRRTKLPLPVVEQDLSRYDNWSRLQQLPDSDPLERLIGDPELGPVALHDSEALSAIALGISLTDPSSPPEDPGPEVQHPSLGGIVSGKYRQGLFTLRQGRLGARDIFGILNEADLAEFTGMRRNPLPDPGNRPGPIDDFLGAVAQAAPTIFSGGLAFAEGAAIAGLAGLTIGGPLAGVTAAVVTGTGATALASFELEAGNVYAELLNTAESIFAETGEEVPILAIKGLSVFVGVMNATLELIGLRQLARLVPGAQNIVARFNKEGPRALLRNRGMRERMISFAKKLGLGAGGEGGTEGLQEVGPTIASNFLIQAHLDPEQKLFTFDDFTDRVLPAAGQGAMAGGGIGIATGPVGFAANQITRAARGKRQAELLDALVEQAKDSDLREQLPQDFADFAQEAAEQAGGDENVYVKAEEFVTYFQAQNIDLETLSEVLPKVLEQIPEARAAGGDLVIPIGQYLAHLAPEHHDGLKPNLRTGIALPSPKEAAVQEKALPEQLAQQVEAAEQERVTGEAIEASAELVFEDVQTQLVEAGSTPEIAQAQATLLREFAKRRAQRLGRTDVFELFKELGLRIEGPGTAEAQAAADVTLEQAATRPKLRLDGQPVNFDALTPDELTVMRSLEGEFLPRGGPVALDLPDAIQRVKNRFSRIAESEGPGLTEDARDIARRQLAAFDRLAPRLQLERGVVRGQMLFGPSLQDVVIRLTESQNLSTFLHEGGHLFLETLRQDAAREGGQLAEDLRIAHEFLGAEPGQLLESRHHEKWARAMETYFFEGKAPSAELQGVFATFRSWMIAVYKAITALGTPLTPEIRGVFDRLLASDEAIEQVHRDDRFQMTFKDAEAAGLTEAEFVALQDAQERSIEEGKNKLDVAILAQSSFRRAGQAAFKAERAEVRILAEREVNARPSVQARHWLQTGEFLVGEAPEGLEAEKLSGEIIEAQWGREVRSRLDPNVWALGLQRTGGLHPDTVAEIFGMASGDELIQKLQETVTRNALIEQITDEIMLEKKGDILNDGTLEAEAVKASENKAQTAFLIADHRAVARQAGQRAVTAKVARDAAQRIIAGKEVKDLRPDLYRNAERRNAREAIAAAVKKDFAAAHDFRLKAVINYFLAIEAQKARDQAQKNRGFHARFNKTALRELLARAGEQYLPQIDALQSQFDLRKSTTLKSIERRKARAAWVAERVEAGDTILIPDWLMNEAIEDKKSWKELTVEEFQGLTDSVKNLEHLARLKSKLIASQDKRGFEAVRDEVVATILARNAVLSPESKEQTKLEGFQSTLNSIHAAHLKLEFIFRRLDGFEDLGPVWTALFKVFADAEFDENVMQKQNAESFAEIFGKIPRQTRAGWKTRRVHISETGDSFTREGLVSLGLNSGNVENIIALKEGFGWDDEQLLAVLNHLTTEEIQAINETHKLIDSFWPEIAALQRELTGLAPEKVEGTPMVLANGVIEGGYYPLKADTRHSILAFKRDEKDKTLGMFESNWLRPQTKQGHTIERKGFGGQKVKLSLSVLSEHLTNVTHDITHRKALIQVDRLTQDTRVAEAITGAIGREQYRVIRPWLKAIAGDKQPMEFAYEKLLSHARAGTTIAYMGFKFTTQFAQVAGFLNSADRVGVGPLVKATADFYGQSIPNMIKQRDFAMERSKVLPFRMRNFDREARDLLKRGGFSAGPLAGLNQDAQRSYLYAIGLFDMGVSIPTWFADYATGMERFNGNEEKAIDLADAAIRLSQGAGTVKDLAAIQRGGELQRMFVNFYSYFSVLYNQGAERIVQIRQGRITLPRAAASSFYLWFAPALISELLAGRGPEEDEEWWKWAAAELTRYPFMAVVGARDVVGHAVNRLQGKPFDFRLTPISDVLGTTAEAPTRIIRDIMDGELRRSTVKESFEAISFWGKLPGRQAWITGEALYDLLTDQGEVVFPRDFFFTRPQERRARP